MGVWYMMYGLWGFLCVVGDVFEGEVHVLFEWMWHQQSPLITTGK